MLAGRICFCCLKIILSVRQQENPRSALVDPEPLSGGSKRDARPVLLDAPANVVDELAVRYAGVRVRRAVFHCVAIDTQQLARGGFGICEGAIGFESR